LRPVSWQQTKFRSSLPAILAADVAGYSRLMGVDEAGTLARLKTIRARSGVPPGERRRLAPA